MSNHNRRTAVLCLCIALLTVLGVLVLQKVHPGSGPPPTVGAPVAPGQKAPPAGSASQSASGVGVQGMPVPSRSDLNVVGEEPAQASIILDVRNPARIRSALSANAWLQKELKQPLGRGFIGSWAGFLGTRGEDMKASFTGPVLDFLADKLLADPFRAVWFSGDQATGTPAIIVPHPSDAERASFLALSTVAHRGSSVAHGCPGTTAPAGQLPKKGPTAQAAPDGGAGPEMEIQRWVLADQPLYAAQTGEQIILGRSPIAVLEGLCAKLPAAEPAAGADLEISVAPEGMGHEAQLLLALLGLGASPHLSLAVEGQSLVPVGLSGPLAVPGRLDVVPTSVDLLKVVPDDTPVLLTLQIKLPPRLDKASIKAFLAAKSVAPDSVTREVAVLWNPRGDEKLHSEVALVWSRPEDATELRAAFSGANHLQTATVCNRLVLSGGPDWLTRIRRACEGQAPSLANASQPVVAGFRTPQSVGVSLQVGRILSQLTADGWTSDGHRATEKTASVPAPPEVQKAQRELEELPMMGFFGVAQPSQLVPGGFHS